MWKEDLSIFFSRYFIDYNAEDDRFFNIDANTGTIKTTQVLDREENPWYNITVAASEKGKLFTLCFIEKDLYWNFLMSKVLTIFIFDARI